MGSAPKKERRIAILGNSHLASLKMGWDQMSSQQAQAQITFFGSSLNEMNSLVVEGRRLIAASPDLKKKMRWFSGGRDFIEVDDYDVFFLHGLELKFSDFLAFARARGPSNRHRMSAAEQYAAFAQMNVDDFFEASPSLILRNKLAPFGLPIIISPAPFPSRRVLDGVVPNISDYWQRQLGAEHQPIPAVAGMLEAWEHKLSTLDALLQPTVTVVSRIFTVDRYSVGAMRFGANLSERTASDDIAHMNADYGKEVLTALLERCGILGQPGEPKQEVPQVETKERDQRCHPYQALARRSAWRHAVLSKGMASNPDWYHPKFHLGDQNIATAGSCFAQHIGRRLRSSGYAFVDTEPAPTSMTAEQHAPNGYGIYSARYGNIYTSRQLLQLFDRAFGYFHPLDNAWSVQGGFVDPFRPTIQAIPFADVGDLNSAREQHLDAVRQIFHQSDLFVFTLGLTETWVRVEDTVAFPVAPGVSGGQFDEKKYRLLNLSYEQVREDLQTFFNKARLVKPGMKFILTVSPIPLMATATGDHVVVATTHSKAVLRAVAGDLANHLAYVDYFPSYELINSHVMRSVYYESDLRSVSPHGVNLVMRHFFQSDSAPNSGVSADPSEYREDGMDDNGVVCDELLLAAFGPGPLSDQD